MSLFAYRAMTAQGRIVRGEMEAINLVDLEMRLRRLELDFIHGNAVRRSRLLRAGGLPRRERIHFCFHLEQLTRSGVPLLDALIDLRDSIEHPQSREVVAQLVESIEGGRNLSQAMTEQNEVFAPVFCSLIRAGETTGNLPEVLRQLTETLKREDELSAYTRRLLIYPCIVAVVVLFALSVSMVMVVPELARLFRSSALTLPLQTRLLISISSFIAHYWWALLLLLVGSSIALRMAIAYDPGSALRWDRFKLALPFVGPVYKKIILARFTGLFCMMYASGIAIVEAVRIAQDTAGNRVVRSALERVEQLIAEGCNLTTAFSTVGLFPPLVVRMMRIGENTGSLDQALHNVSYFYDRDVRESVERAQAMIEPALTLILGLLLLWVMLSVLGPVYDIITKLKL